MAKNKEQTKKKLQDQNEFLKSMLRSFEDIKKGRVRKMKL